MPEPINPENTQSWPETILTGLYKGIPLAWGTASKFASGLQRLGGPGSRIETYWSKCSERTKSIGKVAVPALVGVATTAAWSFSVGATALASIPCAVGLASATTGVTAGLATAAISRYKYNNTPGEAAFHGLGAAFATGSAVSALASPAMVGVGLIAAGPGMSATATTAMAMHPNHMLVLGIPEQGTLVLTTPNIHRPIKPGKPETNPDMSLEDLNHKIDDFKAHHPKTQTWVDPQLAIINNLSKFKGPDGVSLLLKAQRTLEALELNRRTEQQMPDPNRTNQEILEQTARVDQQKIDALSQVLVDANFPIRPEDLNIYLIKKIEAKPFDSHQYRAEKKNTDRQLKLLVDKGSLLGTIYLMHIYGAGQENTDEVYDLMKVIAKEAAESGAESLWAIYNKHLGHKLGFWGKFFPGIIYLLAHSCGLVKNNAKPFLNNVIAGIRGTVDPNNATNLKKVFTAFFEELTLFLDLYNKAAENYANDPEGRSLAFHRKKMVDECGHDLIFAEVKAQLKDGEDIGEKMMEALFQRFSNVLIDKCLPKIEFFPKLKKVAIIGILIKPFARFFEWIINWIYVDCLVRNILPPALKTMVETGFENTTPTQIAYKIAIANTLREQILGFHQDMKNGVVTKPHPMKESDQIDGIEESAERVLTTLKLKRLGKNPSKKKVLNFFKEKELGHSKDPKTDAIIEKEIANGAKELVYLYSHKPEMMEKLMGNLAEVTNDLLQPGINDPTEDDYNDAWKGFKNATDEIVTDVIEGVIKENFKGPATKKYLNESLYGNKEGEGIFSTQLANGIRDFDRLNTICDEMSERLEAGGPEEGVQLIQGLDQYVKMLKRFAADAEGLNVALYPIPVKKAFNQTFHPIYIESADLAQQAIDLQIPHLKYDKYLNLVHILTEIEQLIQQGNPSLTELKSKLAELQEIDDNYPNLNADIPGLDEKIRLLNQHLNGVEIATTAAGATQRILAQLEALGSPAILSENLLADPRKWNGKIRAFTQQEKIDEQNTRELFSAISALQTAHRQSPGVNLAPFKENVEAEMNQFLQKYVTEKEEKEAQAKASLAEIRQITRAAKDEFIAEREELKAELKIKLETLSLQTTNLKNKLLAAQTPTVTIIFDGMPQLAVEDIYYFEGKPKEIEIIGDPMGEKSDNYLDAAFDLLTDSDFYKGSARILMGRTIKGR